MSKARKAESNLFTPQVSNFWTMGSKIKEINKAMLSGMSTPLANTIAAKMPNIKASMKNKRWKDRVIMLGVEQVDQTATGNLKFFQHIMRRIRPSKEMKKAIFLRFED